MTPSRLRAVLAAFAVGPALALAVTTALVACDEDEEQRPVTRLVEASDVAHELGAKAPRIGQELMLALAQAKNFHRRAKVLMSDGNLDEAMASVRRILSLRFPAGAPEAEDVRADARAFLAKLMMTKGDLEEAARIVDEGLADVTRESFFVANLHTVKGEIFEAMAKAADARPEAGKAEAVSLRRRAIESFDRSIAINAAIQRRLVGGGL